MNRSHFNPGHRTMNRLRRDGEAHVSEHDRPTVPSRTTHRLLIADVLEGLARLPDASAHLVVCDPPYNLDLAKWDSIAGYAEWSGRWLADCERVLAPHGSLVVFGGLQYQKRSSGDLIDIMVHLREMSSLRLVNLIVWNYPNGMSAHRFFANRHEEIAWYVKGDRYVFNLDAVREPYDAETKRRYHRDKRLRPESVEKGRNPTNVWRIGRLGANARERTGHPTQKPRALLERLVVALTHPGHVVLDPFAGSGVTCRCAVEHRRHSILIDIDPATRRHVAKQLSDLPARHPPFDLKSE